MLVYVATITEPSSPSHCGWQRMEGSASSRCVQSGVKISCGCPRLLLLLLPSLSPSLVVVVVVVVLDRWRERRAAACSCFIFVMCKYV